jgi:hypothetical protein
MKTKDLFSDAQPPESYHWFTGSQYQDPLHWITNETVINIISMDSGCNDNGVGVKHTEWWIHKKIGGNQWYETERHIIIDNQENDTDSSEGTIKLVLQIDTNGEYYLFHQSTDKLHNKGTIYKKHIIVDTKPSESTMTIGNPACSYIDDDELIYCVTTQTQLKIQSYDQQQPYAVGLNYFEYKIMKNNVIHHHEIVDDYHYKFFQLNEQGLHTIYYRGVDFLGHWEPWKIQSFMVDDQKPTIDLTIDGISVAQPSTPDYWIRSNTSVIINGSNQGGCPTWTMYLKLNDDNPVYITDPKLRPYTLSFPYECSYILEIVANDCVENTASMIKEFYVDNTPPEFEIIKPHNGVYKNGETFHATFFAEDTSQFAPPCYEDHAVGIDHESKGEAWIIDIYPTFQLCKLETDDFIYDHTSNEYDGNIKVPDDCTIPDGSAYLVGGAIDALGNGKHQIKKMIEQYYYTYGSASTMFHNLISDLLDTKQIIEIAIDSNEPEPGAPSVSIAISMICFVSSKSLMRL